MFAQIKASGYAGGYTRVTDYIRAWRASAGMDVKAFVPLKFDLGEAFQFDWSEEGMVVGGIYHRMQVSHMKLCAILEVKQSRFTQSSPSNWEFAAILESHAKAGLSLSWE